MRLRTIAPVVVILVLFVLPASAQNHAPHYVLDAFGGVHAAGGAPAITPATPYFGFDVAASVEYIAVGTSNATGDGIIVLDKWGGVHYGGALAADPPSGATPYFGFDAARAIVARDVPPRIASTSAGDILDLSSPGGLNPVLTLTVYAPTAGYFLVTGSAYVGCSAGGIDNQVSGEISTNVDSVDSGLPTGIGRVIFYDCSDAGGLGYPMENRTVSNTFSVTAGQHTVYLLGRKVTGTGTVRLIGRTLTAVFIAPNAQGQLSAAESAQPAILDESALGVLR